MELKTYKRPAEKKSQAKKERLEGRIPAVIYSQGKEAEAISVDRPNFEQAIAHVQAPRGSASTQPTPRYCSFGDSLQII